MDVFQQKTIEDAVDTRILQRSMTLKLGPEHKVLIENQSDLARVYIATRELLMESENNARTLAKSVVENCAFLSTLLDVSKPLALDIATKPDQDEEVKQLIKDDRRTKCEHCGCIMPNLNQRVCTDIDCQLSIVRDKKRKAHYNKYTSGGRRFQK